MSLRCGFSLASRELAGRYSVRYFASASPVPSRTRLVKDLTPRLSTGFPHKSTRKLLQVAPRDTPSRFTRETARDKSLSRGAPRSGRLRRTRLAENVQNGKRKARKDDIHARAWNQRRKSWRERDCRDGGPSVGIAAEFDFSTAPEAPQTLPSTFSSPPLSSDLLQSVHDMLGHNARPTPIQSLTLKHLFIPPPPDAHRCFLLASETGSGKSLAYLLPMMHDLKATEHLRSRRTGPRALVLAPTHELSRQLASFGKALAHHARLRVQSTSRANVAGGARWASAAKMANAFPGNNTEGEFEVYSGSEMGHAADMLVGTPARLLEMTRGSGWDKEFIEGKGTRRKNRLVGRPEVGLSGVEWVIVDEADILFDSDFINQTLSLLSDVATARGKPVPVISRSDKPSSQASIPLDYPFNFVLTSATIPAALAARLDTHHPTMTRLVSPQLHRLPAHLALEFAPYTSGNRNAEVLGKLRAVWRDDALAGRRRARIIIFANTRVRAAEMGAYLSEHGVANIVVTGHGKDKRSPGSGQRIHGSNKHLAGFLKPLPTKKSPAQSRPPPAGEKGEDKTEPESPHVLLSTSLLARGLDFDQSVSHVFILDPPRNTADFLHRAGRTARAGGSGKVIVFGKGAGRGAGKVHEMRRRLATLRAAKR